MLLSALVLFFVGVVDLLFSLNRIVASLVSIVIALTLLFLIFTTLWPAIQAIRTPDPYLRDAQCAFKSPQSFVMQKILLRVFIAFLHYSILEKLYIKTVNLKPTRQAVQMRMLKPWMWAKSIFLPNRRPLSDLENAIDDVDTESVRSDATVQTLTGTAQRSEDNSATVTPPAEKGGNNMKSAKPTKPVRLGLSKKEVLVRLQATSNWTAWDGRWQDLRHASDSPDKDVKDIKPFIDIMNGLTWLGCTFIRRQDILLAATFCIRSIKNACAISTIINDFYEKTTNMYATEQEKAFSGEAARIRSDHLAVLSSLDPLKVDEAHVFDDLASALIIRFFNDQHWSNFSKLGPSRMELFIRCLNSLPNDKCLTVDNVNITTIIEDLPEDHQLELITAILQRVKNESAQNMIDWDNAAEVLKTFLRINHRKTLRSPLVRVFVAKFNEDLLVRLEENTNTDHYTLACLRFIVKLFYNDFHDKGSYAGLRITEDEFPGFFKSLTPLVWRLDKLLNESRYDRIWDEAAQIVEDINRKELLAGGSGKYTGRVEHEEGWLPKLVHPKDPENLNDSEDRKKWDPLTKEKWMNFVNQFPEEPEPVEPLEEEPAAGPSESGNELTSSEPASIVADNSAASEVYSSASATKRSWTWVASQLPSRILSNK
ncbi:hypothetical protein BDQ12DRAFT_708186 [Crucibulum laeve]|uniref:Uncharacterized protein n=1 Tax=Crucibulum laeve TaxID=68775 RepID=A0A5C3MFK8_9AGAR|nr:hypothetical protein BDQ12DRAFT_708186 [Crucibulum laeve]